MLRIRKEQMDAFKEYMLKQFEDKMVIHLNKYFAGPCGELGEEGVREAIHHGVNQAETYGIVVEYDVSRYINLMFTFGRDFDKDPTLSWAASILNDQNLLGRRQKMDALYAEAGRHLAAAAGVDNRGFPKIQRGDD
jgi:hypothetical protein